jgi:Domain of unknown function (DUF4034)
MFMNHHRCLLIPVLILCGVASGCNFASLTQSKASTSADAQPPTAVDLEVDAAKDYKATPKYAAQVRSYLEQEKFDQIDEIADTVRAGKTRFSGGHWKLNKLYKGLTEPANHMRAPDAVWRAHIGRLKKWVEQKPKSITARVALASAYVDYAWQARGRGYADTVSEDGASLFEQRLALAENVLNDAQKLEAKCPHWYFVMQILAKGQGWERARYEKNFEAGVAFEPTYHYLFSEKAQYLLPRWFGEEGEWERFAEETSQRLSGKLGSITYYRIAMDLEYYYKDRTFFTESQISWPKIKQGFADVEEAHGVSMSNMNALCHMAGQAGDRPFTQSLLTRIGDTWDPEVWKNRNYFEHYKAWAYDRR